MTSRASRSALGDVLFERKPTGSDQFSLFTVDAGVGRNPSPAGPWACVVAAFNRT